MMGRFLPILLLALAVGPSTLAPASERVMLTGSSTVAPLALEIGKRFERLHPESRFEVQTGGSTRGVLDASSGMADIGMASRALKATEQDLTAHTIALDGIGIIVHQSNPVGELSREQIVAVFTGEIRNWQALGGPDRHITVVNKAEGRSTLELFLQHFGLRNSQIRAQVVIGDNQQGIKTVAGNPGAIGYVSIGAAESEQERGVAIRRLPLDGVPASVARVRDGSYPLARPLNLITRGDIPPRLKGFIDYARSAAVSDLVEGLYFVPLRP